MISLHNKWINNIKNNVCKSYFKKYDNNSDYIDNIIDYKINNDLLLDYKLKIKNMIPMPIGVAAASYFIKDNYIYMILGISHNKGGSHNLPLKGTGSFNNNIFRYNILDNKWDNLGKIRLHQRSAPISFTYKNKFYIAGGSSFIFEDPEYLKKYEKIYGKWPSKKGKWYSNDLTEISIIDNKVEVNITPLEIFSNVDMSSIIINNKLYFTGGTFGKKQKNFMSHSELSYYIKDPIWKEKLKKMGDKIYSGSLIFYIDMNNINNGINIECFFPGIPCVQYQMEENNNYLYLFSSHTFRNSSISKHRPLEMNRTICKDVWKYNLSTKEWSRINNFPLKALNCFKVKKINSDIAIIYGGCNGFIEISIDNIKKISNTDDRLTIDNYRNYIDKIPESIIEYVKDNKRYKLKKSEINPYFRYGTISNTYSLFNETDQKNVTALNNIKAYDYFQHYFSDIILFYKFSEDKYYLSPYNLPFNIAGSNSECILINNSIYIFGGEINDILINKKFPMITSCLVTKIECDQFI